jgi:hypothetical protein
MTGTVGKYCSAIIRRENNIAFEELLNRMEKRFKKLNPIIIFCQSLQI